MFLKIVKIAMSLVFYDFAFFRLLLQRILKKNLRSLTWKGFETDGRRAAI
jgi:hypothetical protein